MFKKMFKECTMETEAETAGKVMAELEKCIMTIATFCQQKKDERLYRGNGQT